MCEKIGSLNSLVAESVKLTEVFRQITKDRENMFCPKCGTENPNDGKFCRKCGTDLEIVSDAISGNLPVRRHYKNKKNKTEATWEGALTLLFVSFAFFVISIFLAFQPIGKYWWFWILVPAFATLGPGIAQIISLRQMRQDEIRIISEKNASLPEPESANALPPKQTEFVSNIPDMKHRTEDLAPPSVVEGTTRKLEMNAESETMNLPEKE